MVVSKINFNVLTGESLSLLGNQSLCNVDGRITEVVGGGGHMCLLTLVARLRQTTYDSNLLVLDISHLAVHTSSV